ncbi:RING finger protein 141-like isoform X2 [Amblyomma americanum]
MTCGFQEGGALSFVTAVTWRGMRCQYLVDTKNRRLIFEVHSSSDTPVLWKSEVRVSCKRVPVGSAEEEASRFLTLRQFLHTYHTIKAYYTAAVAACGASPAASDMGASALFSGVLGSSGSGAELEECCICMEHRPEVTLPCTHSYCLRCIEQWFYFLALCCSVLFIMPTSNDLCDYLGQASYKATERVQHYVPTVPRGVCEHPGNMGHVGGAGVVGGAQRDAEGTGSVPQAGPRLTCPAALLGCAQQQ